MTSNDNADLEKKVENPEPKGDDNGNDTTPIVIRSPGSIGIMLF